MFSCLVGERELGCIAIWVFREYYCALLYFPIFIVKFLRHRYGGRQFTEPRKFLCSCVLYICLLFNFCLFTIINLSPGCYLHNKHKYFILFLAISRSLFGLFFLLPRMTGEDATKIKLNLLTLSFFIIQ